LSNRHDLPVGDPQAIAAILAAGYLRYRRPRQQIPLDSAAEQSRHVYGLTTRRKENPLEPAVHKQIEELRHMTVAQLRQKYLEVLGQESRSGHRQYLFRRIAWQLQALAEGGLSERARRRALEIANDADLRIRAPKHLARAGIRTADHSGCVS